jgi:hypothetical protein
MVVIVLSQVSVSFLFIRAALTHMDIIYVYVRDGPRLIRPLHCDLQDPLSSLVDSNEVT